MWGNERGFREDHSGSLNFLGQWFPGFRAHQRHPTGLLEHNVLGSTPRVSDLVDLG